MALATYGAALTAIREVLDDGAGSLRTIASARFADKLHDGLSEDELARRGAQASIPFRVALGNFRRHPASPPINGNVNLIAFDVDVTTSRTITPLEQADADAMARLTYLAAEDGDAVRQALETPPNLNATAAGISTNLSGGCLRHLRSNPPRTISTGAPPAKAQRLETTHRFEGVIKVFQAPTAFPSSGLVALWELADAATSGGDVTGLDDASGAGNDLSPLDFGSGAPITLATDADYGGATVALVPGGGDVLIRGNFAAPLAQPYTVLWLGEWTGSADGAAYDGADDSATLYRESGVGFVSAGTAASVGAIADDTPHPTLTVFNGAATTHRAGAAWYAPLTVNAGSGTLDGWLFAAGNGGTRSRAGKDAIGAIWNRALNAPEIAQLARYLNENYGQSVVT